MKHVALVIAAVLMLSGCAGSSYDIVRNPEYGPIDGPVLTHNGRTNWIHARVKSERDDLVTHWIQTDGKLNRVGGASQTHPFKLQIYPCDTEVAIYSEYINLTDSMLSHGLGYSNTQSIQRAANNYYGWYRVDSYKPADLTWWWDSSEKHIFPAGETDSALIERIKRTSKLRVMFPYYKGNTIVEFDVRGAAKELKKIHCN